MEAAEATRPLPESEYEGVLSRTERAYLLAQSAAGNLADALAGNGEAYAIVETAEAELDRLDSQVDATVTAAVAEVTPAQARELLACMKFMIDLERIGDLLASVATCARAMGDRVGMDDVTDLVKLASVLEKMLLDVHGAFRGRDTDRAMIALRTDAEMDRVRNLMIIRHLEQAQVRLSYDSVQVLFMAQALERAGDHVKNIAEEVCHLVSGHTVRHLLQNRKKSGEQIYLEWLRNLHSVVRVVKEDEMASHLTATMAR
jgi:phosphate transport system protein